jgi:hypothetical protein
VTEAAGGVAERSIVVALAAVMATTLLAGCDKGTIVGGSTKPMEYVEPTDDFLPHPELLSALWDLTHMKPGLNPQVYRAIYLEPVAILTCPSPTEVYATDGATGELLSGKVSTSAAVTHHCCKTRPTSGLMSITSLKLAVVSSSPNCGRWVSEHPRMPDDVRQEHRDRGECAGDRWERSRAAIKILACMGAHRSGNVKWSSAAKEGSHGLPRATDRPGVSRSRSWFPSKPPDICILCERSRDVLSAS